MTEPVTEQTEEAAPTAEFSDELSDEALDRAEGSTMCHNGPCTKGCGGSALGVIPSAARTLNRRR